MSVCVHLQAISNFAVAAKSNSRLFFVFDNITCFAFPTTIIVEAHLVAALHAVCDVVLALLQIDSLYVPLAIPLDVSDSVHLKLGYGQKQTQHQQQKKREIKISTKLRQKSKVSSAMNEF